MWNKNANSCPDNLFVLLCLLSLVQIEVVFCALSGTYAYWRYIAQSRSIEHYTKMVKDVWFW